MIARAPRIQSVQVCHVHPEIVDVFPDEDWNPYHSYSTATASVPITEITEQSVTRSCSHRVTLGGFTVQRNADDELSNSDSCDSRDKESQTVMDALCANTLIDNRVAAIFTNKQHGPNAVQRALSGLLEESDVDKPGLSLWMLHRRPSVDIDQAMAKNESIRSTNGSSASIQEDSIKLLFAPGAVRHLKSHHNSLNRVVKQIFCLEDIENIKNSTSKDWKDSKSASRTSDWSDERGKDEHLLSYVQRKIRAVATSTYFTLLFMVLTVYVLFGPDLIKLYADKSVDKFFVTLHTIVFFLFCSEFVLLGISNPEYLCSLGAPLDLVAMFSMFGDTVFLEDTSLAGNSMVQRSKLARLARVARIARITRLVPRIIQIFRKRKRIGWAKKFVVRRLRRAFLYLDMDRDGDISSFDIKVFYLSVLQDCSSMLYHSKNEVLAADAELLVALSPERTIEAELGNKYSFQEFIRIFFSMMLGRDVLLYHLWGMQDESGVWAMTAKLSDKTALKVCCGILCLVVFMKLLETYIEDGSFQQGLFHTYWMILTERRMKRPLNSSYVCAQIGDLVAEAKVLFLYIDGIIWKDVINSEASCSTPVPFDGDPFSRIDDIMNQVTLRTTEVLQACLPHFENQGDRCRLNYRHNAVALADVQDQAKEDIFFAMLSSMVCMIIIMGFIIGFTHGINSFTRTTLQPLRALVDDMSAMSAVELVHIDAEIHASQGDYGEVPTKVEEMVRLQRAFESMKGVIRSWSKYVPPTVVQKLFGAGMEATVGVSKTWATVLFVDVDGFEDACHGMGPDDVNDLLATVFEKIAFAISNNRGTLLEFIADEVLAVFNTPSPLRSHCYAGVITALEIHQHIAELPELATPDGRRIKIRCRCGVHTAQILAGNIGSHRRMKYGLLGDGVNLTARLKGLNSRYNTQTIASESCFLDDLSSRRAIFRPLDLVAVKGKTEAIKVYEIMELSRGSEQTFVTHMAAQKHAEAFRLYHEMKFSEAKAMFSEVASEYETVEHRCRLSASTLDHPARLMRKRCIMYMRDPPGPDWDGVERLKAKTFEVLQDEDDGSLEMEGNFATI